MSHSNDTPSSLLVNNLKLVAELNSQHKVLDLACGEGRNGIFLLKNNVPVVFADKSKSALEAVAVKLQENGQQADCRQVDLEVEGQSPLAGNMFAAVMVFNYLHRPLMETIREIIEPGGLIIYETFTTENRQFGRPNNPDFLLKQKELGYLFEDWDILHCFEGTMQNPQRAIANIVARKPLEN